LPSGFRRDRTGWGIALTALALAHHDPDGRTVRAVRRLGGALLQHFPFVAINATTDTHQSVLDAFASELGASVVTHPPDEEHIGTARRDVVELAIELGGEQVLYSDADHILRWIAARPDEVESALSGPVADLLVVGRSPEALDASPQRLRETERVVNHIYSLMRPGRAWDLMFAVRRLSPAAVKVIVDLDKEPTVANDVTWPLLVEDRGLSVTTSPPTGSPTERSATSTAAPTTMTATPSNGSVGWRSPLTMPLPSARSFEFPADPGHCRTGDGAGCRGRCGAI